MDTKSKSGSILATCGGLLALVIIYIVISRIIPGWLNRQAARDAARTAVDDAATQAASDVARQQIAQIARDSANQSVPLPGTLIDRADYQFTLPNDCTLNHPDPNGNSDNPTTINLFNGPTLNILVVDDKSTAPGALNDLAKVYKDAMTNTSTAPCHAFDALNPQNTTAFTGNEKGYPFTFELAQVDGNHKSFVLVLEYLNEKKSAALDETARIIATFKIKDQ